MILNKLESTETQAKLIISLENCKTTLFNLERKPEPKNLMSDQIGFIVPKDEQCAKTQVKIIFQ